MDTREAAVNATQESLAVRNGGEFSWTLKRSKGWRDMRRKRKLERRGGQMGIYVRAKRRGAAPGARYPIEETPNPAGPTPTTK